MKKREVDLQVADKCYMSPGARLSARLPYGRIHLPMTT